MTRAMVTGATGFLGQRMANQLSDGGIEVLATYFHKPPQTHWTPKWDGRLEHLDVRNGARVAELVEEFRPDVVYHFAGQAYVTPSWEHPVATFDVNLTGTLHLLEAIRRYRPRCALGFAGSGTEYGDAESIPTPESAPLLPTSPYAASKAGADLLCYQYFRSYGLPVYRFRIFGTTGVGKLGDVCNDFASQIARAEVSPVKREVHVGDLSRRRDIMDVRDAIGAMSRIVEMGAAGEAYNIGSGEARPISDVLAALTQLAAVPVKVVTDASRKRLIDEPVHLGDIRRLRELGWEPKIPLSETLTDILGSWRAQLRAPPHQSSA